jgi:phenylpropionate dioxygenase-like ring-hydroxylating dioxygenase large terminal subunit
VTCGTLLALKGAAPQPWDSEGIVANTNRFEDAAPDADDLGDLRWGNDPAEIPDWIYTDARVYAREQARIFRGRSWNYVALEAELPLPGDFVRSYAGETPVIVARDAAGAVNVFENRCSHRGAEFCKTYRGNAQQFVCPYHQWTYDLAGALVAVPFRRGVKGKGGMPEDFDLAAHGLRRLTVACRHGVVFASFRDDTPPLDQYLGPEIAAELDTIFAGRKVRVLGNHRNLLPINWKLYQENLKDPYHATLLHTYLTTFGLFVAGNRTGIVVDDEGKHSALLNARPAGGPANDETKREIGSFKAGLTLADPRVLEFVDEFDAPWSSSAMALWPNFLLLRQLNILNIRQLVPQGPHALLLLWTAFGYEDDSPDMTQHRLRQNNIFGPGGFLGIDDNEALKFVQDGLMRSVPRVGLAPLGSDQESADTVITDRAIRRMYAHYRAQMGL